ncbi:MAG TPA: S8 family serine peptidase [Longimicrobiaceae bacterium]|nr:S8 family serine peptidase [Longimicrobiaceae bacterium]
MLEVLARYLEPRQVAAPAGASVFDLIRAECGTAKPVHAEFFHRLNPAVHGAVLQEAQTVALPPCPFWETDARTVVPPGSTIATQVELATGVAGPRTLRSVRRLNASLRRAAVWSAAAEGETVRLPYAVLPAAFTLRQAHARDGQGVVAELASLPGALVVELDHGSTDLVQEVEPAAAAEPCTGPAAGEAWPFSSSALVAALQRNDALRVLLRAPARPSERVLVGIGDTGIEDSEGRLPLFNNSKEQNTRDFDDDGNGYVDDVTGANMPSRRGPPNIERLYGRRAHGTGVAGLAVGGLADAALTAEVARLVSLSILSLVQRTTVASPSGPVSSFSYPKHGIGATLSYKPDNGPISILNLSIESPEEMETFEEALDKSSALVVVAAGNEGKNLDFAVAPVFPAYYGRRHPEQIITVAAHNALTADQRAAIRAAPAQRPGFEVLAPFTNRGVRSVHLAAPGCRVESIDLGGGRAAFNGSSYAAPLVTFAAALLMAERITSPARIKNRILASVDVVPGLEVYSGGMLNVEKALAVFEDVVEMRSGERFRGRIQGPVRFPFGVNSLEWRDVLKVVPLTTREGETTVRLFWRRPLDQMDILEGTTTLREVQLFDWDARVVRTLPLADVADLIPAAPEFRSLQLP